MTREEQLRFCKICTKQKFDLQQGIICSLTDKKADFEDSCDWFEQDSSVSNDLSEFSIEKFGKVANHKKRFLNFIIDYVGIYTLTIALAFLYVIVCELLNIELYPFETQSKIAEKITEYVLGAVMGTFYYSLFEALSKGRSLGKLVTKTKVVTEDGETPDFKTIFIRSLCRYVPFNALSFLGGEPTGWHDQWSKTKVVEI